MDPVLTTAQIENIQIDHAVIYSNFGEADAQLLGPTRGGGGFKATATIRDIPFDGQKGKTKGMQVVESIDAMLSVVHLDTSMASLATAMPYATYDDVLGTITCGSSNIGVMPDTAYLKNITMFCKTIKGEYKKITIYNPMNLKDFELAAKPKGEGEVSLELNAHWDPKDASSNLFLVEDVADIVVAP